MSALVNFPIDYTGGSVYSISTSGKSSGTFYDFPGMDTLIYVPDGTEARGRVKASTPLGHSVSVRFSIGSQLSSASSYFLTAGGVWSPEVSFGPMVGTGWISLQWQVRWTSSAPASITVAGHNINQV